MTHRFGQIMIHYFRSLVDFSLRSLFIIRANFAKNIFSPKVVHVSSFFEIQSHMFKNMKWKWFLWEFLSFSVKEKRRNNRLLCHVTQIRSPLFHFSLLRISIFIFFFIFTDLEIKCRIYWKTEKDFWSGQPPNQWLKRKITGKLHFHPKHSRGIMSEIPSNRPVLWCFGQTFDRYF